MNSSKNVGTPVALSLKPTIKYIVRFPAGTTVPVIDVFVFHGFGVYLIYLLEYLYMYFSSDIIIIIIIVY